MSADPAGARAATRMRGLALGQALLAIGQGQARLLREAVVQLCAGGGQPLDVDALDRALAQFIARRLGPGMKPGAELFPAFWGCWCAST